MLCGGGVELTGETGPNYHKIYENSQPSSAYAVSQPRRTVSVKELHLV